MHSGQDEEPHDGDIHHQRPRRGHVGLCEPPHRQPVPRERPQFVEQVVVDDRQLHRQGGGDHEWRPGHAVQHEQGDRVDHDAAGPDQREPDDPVVVDGVPQPAAHGPPRLTRTAPHPPQLAPAPYPGQVASTDAAAPFARPPPPRVAPTPCPVGRRCRIARAMFGGQPPPHGSVPAHSLVATALLLAGQRYPIILRNHGGQPFPWLWSLGAGRPISPIVCGRDGRHLPQKHRARTVLRLHPCGGCGCGPLPDGERPLGHRAGCAGRAAGDRPGRADEGDVLSVWG